MNFNPNPSFFEMWRDKTAPEALAIEPDAGMQFTLYEIKHAPETTTNCPAEELL